MIIVDLVFEILAPLVLFWCINIVIEELSSYFKVFISFYVSYDKNEFKESIFISLEIILKIV